MKTVLKHIFQHKRAYAQLPFFDFLRDDDLSPRERLAFFPCMASFILSFGDLNRLVLRVEPTDDPWQKMINAHTYEDDHHWPWYLEDFTKLGHDDVKRPPGDTLRFLYSDATIQNRLLAHRLAHLVWGAEPVVRLAIIEAIEETGQVLFALTSSIAAQYQHDTGTELRYCGDNAAMESFFALLQKNVLDRRSWTTREQLRIAIVTWIERTYHRRRRQPRLGRLTPIEFETIMNTTVALAA